MKTLADFLYSDFLNTEQCSKRQRLDFSPLTENTLVSVTQKFMHFLSGVSNKTKKMLSFYRS